MTHMYEFAHHFYQESGERTIFLQAERQKDGTRTFKMIEGEPLATSYGEDLYRKIFGTDESVPFLKESEPQTSP